MVIKDDSEVELTSDDDLEGVPNLFFLDQNVSILID
jgi:hypothetical protein